jgi:hypothetical protein
MPVLDGKWRKRSIAASNPPADPPMPTIGQLWFALAGSGLAFALGAFDCGNFLPLVFIREDDALDNAFRFAAMRPFYVSLGLRCIQAAIVNALSSTRYLIACGFAARYSRVRRWMFEGCRTGASV